MRTMSFDAAIAISGALTDAIGMASVVRGWMSDHLDFDKNGPVTLSCDQREQAIWAMNHLERLISEADRLFHAERGSEADADQPA